MMKAAILIAVVAMQPLVAQQKIEPGGPIDYMKLAIYPSHWRADNVPTTMFPWFGKEVAFVTTTAELDPAAVAHFVGVLDRTWACLRDLHGGWVPNPRWNLRDKPVVAMIPSTDPLLTCDLWCSRVGVNGAEIVGFYEDHLPAWLDEPHLVDFDFAEALGHNYFAFGKLHGRFDRGYGRFNAMVAFEKLGLKDLDVARPAFIRDSETTYHESRTSFRSGLLSDLEHRIATGFDNRKVPHSGPDSVYASIMLRLRKENGGDRFHKRFVTAMRAIEERRKAKDKEIFETAKRKAKLETRGRDDLTDEQKRKMKDEELALFERIRIQRKPTEQEQIAAWAEAICVAAGKDLTRQLIDRWRFPLVEGDLDQIRKALRTPLPGARGSAAGSRR